MKLITTMSEYGYKYFEGSYSNGIYNLRFYISFFKKHNDDITINIDQVIKIIKYAANENDSFDVECKNENELYDSLLIIFAK